MRQLKIMMGLALCAALLTTGCPKDDSDSGTPGTDALPGTDAVPGTDMGATDMGVTDMGTMGVVLTVNVEEALDPNPQMNIDVDLYALAAPTTSLVTGNTGTAGTVDLTVPPAALPVMAPFFGATAATYKDTYTFFPSPIMMSRVIGSTGFIRVFSGSTWAILLGALTAAGGTEDQTRGFVSGAVVDATGTGIAGATVSVDTADGTSVTMYIDATTGLPGTGTVTDTDGQFIIFNIPAGATVVTTDAAGGLPTNLEVFADAVHLVAVIAP